MTQLNLKAEPWQIAEMLTCLLKSYEGPFPDEGVETQTLLERHPFGLSVPAVDGLPRTICILEFPGYTRPSVEAMAAVIGAQLDFAGREFRQAFYLRIIECVERTLADGEVHCNLYFEVGGLTKVFIVGGVNNYSGAGGAGGRTLECMFEFAGALAGMPVERVRIEESVARAMERQIVAAYNAQREPEHTS